MKHSLIALAFALAASMAMAHGPPSVLDSRGVVVQQQVGALPAIGGGLAIMADNECSTCRTAATHGGGSGGITSAPAHQGFPPNERMLN